MAPISLQSKRSGSRKITPMKMILAIACCFGLLFLLENSRTDANDYDTNVVNAMRKEGYEVKVENLEVKTEKPKQIHLHQPDEKETSKDTSKEGDEPFDRNVPHGKAWPSPMEIFGENAELKLVPIFGQHRADQDAVFSFAKDAAFEHLVRFVGSLLKTGYTGDIVLAVNQKHELKEETLQYLEYHAQHSNLIVYAAELVCKKIKVKVRCKVFKMFIHKTIGGYLPDPRPHRELAQLRFEYYWAWSLLYSPKSRLFLLDAKDLMFQKNPFPLLPANFEKKMMFFEETGIKSIGDEPNNRLWLREGHERKYLHKLGRKFPVNAGTIVGSQAAIESFSKAMVNQWDTSQCTIFGCDQGHVNFLVHGNFLVGSPGIEEVIVQKFGDSFVMSLALQILYGGNLRKSKIVQGGSDNIMMTNGEPAAIVHQFDKDEELKAIYKGKKTEPFLNDWAQIKAKLGK